MLCGDAFRFQHRICRLSEYRPSAFQPKDKPGQGQNANGKNGIPDHPHPSQGIHQAGFGKFSRAGIPHAMLHAGPGLHEDSGKI